VHLDDGAADRQAHTDPVNPRRPATIELVKDSLLITAAFLGSLVEFVEALTIVLAVGTVRG
jgi:hypothetical protein